MSSNISFLGGGNMASSIIGGLIEAGFGADSITVSDPNPNSLAGLSERWGLRTTHSNQTAVKQADVVVIAVKPQVLFEVCEDISASLQPNSLVISIAAGKNSNGIDAALGGEKAIVRCMPNTPALVKQGASVLFANACVTAEQKAIAHTILEAVGYVAWIEDEALMDAVTALSGSGPAYIFLVIEAMIDAGIELGLAPDLAENLALQTALGASQLAEQSEDKVAELRRKVTSPKGTTERAIETFEARHLRDIFKDAMRACALRSKELGAENSV